MRQHFLVFSRGTFGVLWDSVVVLSAYYEVMTDPPHYRLLHTVVWAQGDGLYPSRVMPQSARDFRQQLVVLLERSKSV